MYVDAGSKDVWGNKATVKNCEMRYELTNCDDAKCTLECRSVPPFQYTCGKCGSDKLSCFCYCTC